MVVQEALYIPDNIAIGIATGKYRQIGGVVRYAIGPNKGKLVKLLEPAPQGAVKQAKGIVTNAVQFFQQNKKQAIIGTIIAGVLLGGAWLLGRFGKREPKVLREFRKVLKKYVEAAQKGKLSTKKIDELICALEALKAHKKYKKLSIQLTAEEFGVLVELIREYTIKLAEDNDVELNRKELRKNRGVIIDLETYLTTQKKIFEKAA